MTVSPGTACTLSISQRIAPAGNVVVVPVVVVTSVTVEDVAVPVVVVVLSVTVEDVAVPVVVVVVLSVTVEDVAVPVVVVVLSVTVEVVVVSVTDDVVVTEVVVGVVGVKPCGSIMIAPPRPMILFVISFDFSSETLRVPSAKSTLYVPAGQFAGTTKVRTTTSSFVAATAFFASSVVNRNALRVLSAFVCVESLPLYASVPFAESKLRDHYRSSSCCCHRSCNC